MPLMNELNAHMARLASDEACKAVVLTGTGAYYSAGVDLSSMIKPMAPSALVSLLRSQNQALFDMFLDYPKVLVAAVNGPAIGAAVTSCALFDGLVAAEAATFSTPFSKLGITPEGCSSVRFPELMGEEAAQRMLGPEGWAPTGAEAKAAGFVDELVADAAHLPDAAHAAARAALAAGGGRRKFDADAVARYKAVNAVESADLANAFVDAPFFDAMAAHNAKRNPQAAFFFRAAKATLPLWQPAKILPA
jgi:peroxisomal 3,2-trans-enoyl-CoA isomerase